MTPVLPFEPESVESALARFPEALATPYNVFEEAEKLFSPLSDSPLLRRKHIFDFHDGVRMIAAVEHGGGLPIHIHMSFGCHNNTPLAELGGPAWEARIKELIPIFVGERKLLFNFTSPKGLPNFFFAYPEGKVK